MPSGAAVAAYVVLDGTEDAAAHRFAELSQAQLAFACDVTSIGFSKVWLAMGIFRPRLRLGDRLDREPAAVARLVGTRCVGSPSRVGPLIWTHEGVWFAPYAAFWLWLLTTCVLLVPRILARHADPRTTQPYDRARGNLDRHGSTSSPTTTPGV